MIAVVRRLPAVLAMLLLAAHFLREGRLAVTILCVAPGALALVARPWAVRLMRGVLVVGSVIWSVTAWQLAQARMAAGSPHARMLIILLAVAAFTALAAWLLPGARREGQG